MRYFEEFEAVLNKACSEICFQVSQSFETGNLIVHRKLPGQRFGSPENVEITPEVAREIVVPSFQPHHFELTMQIALSLVSKSPSSPSRPCRLGPYAKVFIDRMRDDCGLIERGGTPTYLYQ